MDQPRADSGNNFHSNPSEAAFKPDGTGGSDAASSAELIDEAQQTAKDLAQDVKDKAAEAAEPIKEQAESFADEKKEQGARRIGNFARAVHKAADEIGKQSPAAARYVHASAEKLESASSTLGDKSVGELFEQADRMAHERPIAVFAGSVAAGFLLARLLRSSASTPPGA